MRTEKQRFKVGKLFVLGAGATSAMLPFASTELESRGGRSARRNRQSRHTALWGSPKYTPAPAARYR